MLLLAACSCTDTAPRSICHPDRHLTTIDTLMWQQPDSAFSQLQAFAVSPAMDSLDAFNGHYFHLLLSELLYKNDYAQTNRNELLQAVGYYDSLVVEEGNRVHLDLAFLDARAHYINGVGYYEIDSVVPACEEYLKALEIMENHFDEKDLVGHKAKFMALTFTRLFKLFSNRYLHEQAIYFGKRSLLYYHKYDAEPWHIPWIMEGIGSHYDIMEQLDSASTYYQEAALLIDDSTGLMYRDLLSHRAYLTYKQKHDLSSVLDQWHWLLLHAENDKEFVARCCCLGELYYYEHQWDSAEYYMNIVYHGLCGPDSKMLAAKRLQEIFLISRDTVKANKYGLFFSSNTSTIDQYGTLDSQLTQLQYAFQQKTGDRIHQQGMYLVNKRVVTILGVVFMVLIVLMCTTYFNNKLLNRLKMQNGKIIETLESERYAHQIQQAALGGKLKNSNAQIKKNREKKHEEVFPIAEKCLKNNPSTLQFVDEPICQFIREQVKKGQFKSHMKCSVYKDYALDREQLLALRKAADHHFSLFTIRLKKAYPQLSNGDLTYCCLYLLGLSDADVSALMQKEYSTVSEHSRKIKRVLGDETLVSVLQNFSYSSDL